MTSSFTPVLTFADRNCSSLRLAKLSATIGIDSSVLMVALTPWVAMMEGRERISALPLICSAW